MNNVQPMAIGSPSQMTVTSSKWLQLCWNIWLWEQLKRLSSVPAHTTLSRVMGPEPAPNVLSMPRTGEPEGVKQQRNFKELSRIGT